jgi:hypothetical protein
MQRQTSLTRALIADGLNGGRVPFDFRRRVAVARTYMDEGALLSAAERLEKLAADLREAATASREGQAA